ncbi:radical SAM protein [Candidatus Bipolaricaulota bacterium]|nr:radical SAM protein [Candidatus Bipolaricaulota bacterium]
MATFLTRQGWKLSRYLLTAELPTGDLRVFSTLWKSVVDLDHRHQNLLFGETSSATPEELENLRALKDLGIIVDADVDEGELAVERINCWTQPDQLSIIYCLTLACNFACVYCVQKGTSPEPTHSAEMTAGVRKQAVDFTFRMLDQLSLSKLDVTFFGGEPLLNYDGVLDILAQIELLKRKRALTHICCGIVSNGSLLDIGRLRLLKSMGVTDLQLTVDGLPETHNLRRKSAHGSWGKIWETIIFATDLGMHVVINVVVDVENMDEVLQFIDIVDRIAAGNPQVKAKSSFVFGLLIPTLATYGRCQQVLFGQEARIFDKIIDCYIYAQKHGWEVFHMLLQVISSHESPYSFIIGPAGDLYKCFSTIGNPKYSIGSIWDQPDDIIKRSRQFTDRHAWDAECLACPIFPLCRGGCQAIASLSHNGEFGHKLCERTFRIFGLKRALAEGVF